MTWTELFCFELSDEPKTQKQYAVPIPTALPIPIYSVDEF